MNKKIILSVIAVSIMLILVGGIIGYYISNKSRYEVSPLIYGIDKLEKLNNVNFSCGCYATDYPLKPFYFDDGGIYDEPPQFNLA